MLKKIGQMCSDSSFIDVFRDLTPVAKETKVKINKWNFSKL